MELDFSDPLAPFIFKVYYASTYNTEFVGQGLVASNRNFVV